MLPLGGHYTTTKTPGNPGRFTPLSPTGSAARRERVWSVAAALNGSLAIRSRLSQRGCTGGVGSGWSPSTRQQR